MSVGKSFVWFLILVVLVSDKAAEITNAASLSAAPEGPDGERSLENVTQISGDTSNGHFEATSLEVVSDQQERSLGSTEEVPADSVSLSNGSQTDVSETTENHENISELLSVSPLNFGAVEDVATDSMVESDVRITTSEDGLGENDDESLWEGEDILEETTTLPENGKITNSFSTSVIDMLNNVTKILSGNSTPLSNENETRTIDNSNQANEDTDHLFTSVAETGSKIQSIYPHTNTEERINKESVESEASIFNVPHSNTSEPLASSITIAKENISVVTGNQSFESVPTKGNAEFFTTSPTVNMNDKEVIVEPVLQILNPNNSSNVSVDDDSDFSNLINEINTKNHLVEGNVEDATDKVFISTNNTQGRNMESAIETTTNNVQHTTVDGKSDGEFAERIEANENNKLISNTDQTSTTIKYLTTTRREEQLTETSQYNFMTQKHQSFDDEKQSDNTTSRTEPSTELYGTSTMRNIEDQNILSKIDNGDENLVTEAVPSEKTTTEDELNNNVTTTRGDGNEDMRNIAEVIKEENLSLAADESPLIPQVKEDETYYTTMTSVEETSEYHESSSERSITKNFIKYEASGGVTNQNEAAETNGTDEANTNYEPVTNTEKYLMSTILVQEPSEDDENQSIFLNNNVNKTSEHSLNALNSEGIINSELDNINKAIDLGTSTDNYRASTISEKEMIEDGKNISAFTSNNDNTNSTSDSVNETVDFAASSENYSSLTTSKEEINEKDGQLSVSTNNSDIKNSKLNNIDESAELATSTENYSSSSTSRETMHESDEKLMVFTSSIEDISNSKINNKYEIGKLATTTDSSTSVEKTVEDGGSWTAFMNISADVTNSNISKTDEYITSTEKYDAAIISTEQLPKNGSSELSLVSEKYTTESSFQFEENYTITHFNNVNEETTMINSKELNTENKTDELTTETENLLTTFTSGAEEKSTENSTLQITQESSEGDENLMTFLSNVEENPTENSTILLISQQSSEDDENLMKFMNNAGENNTTYISSSTETIMTNTNEDYTDEIDEAGPSTANYDIILVPMKNIEEPSTSSVMSERNITENSLELEESKDSQEEIVITNSKENNTNENDEPVIYTEKYNTLIEIDETTSYYRSTDGTIITNNRGNTTAISGEEIAENDERYSIRRSKDSKVNDANDIFKNNGDSHTLIGMDTVRNEKDLSESDIYDEVKTNEATEDSSMLTKTFIEQVEKSQLVHENEEITFKYKNESNDTTGNNFEEITTETSEHKTEKFIKVNEMNDSNETSTNTKESYTLPVTAGASEDNKSIYETDTYGGIETTEETVDNESMSVTKYSDDKRKKLVDGNKEESQTNEEPTTASSFESMTTPGTLEMLTKEILKDLKDEMKKIVNDSISELEETGEPFLPEHSLEITETESGDQKTEADQAIESSSETYLEFGSTSEKIDPDSFGENNKTLTFDTVLNESSDKVDQSMVGSKFSDSEGSILEKSVDGRSGAPKDVHVRKDNVIIPVIEEKYVNFVTGEVFGRMANVSIKITVRDSSFYVPTSAHFSVDASSLLLNITWPSSGKLPDNCLSFALTNTSKNYIIKNIQLHFLQSSRMETWHKNVSIEDYTSEKGDYSVEIGHGVAITVSNLDFLEKPESEELLANEVGRSTVQGSSDHLDMGIAIGVVSGILLICVIGYVLVTRSRKRTLIIEGASKHDIPA